MAKDIDLLVIDGAYGEAGGQILRSALSLSALLKRPFRIENVRAGRERPGLQRQHLTAVQACAQICDAEVKGAELNSIELEFNPGRIKSGNLRFDTGTAASTTLIFQGIALPLAFGSEKSNLEIVGGTNNPHAPSVLYLQRIFLPTVKRLGFDSSTSVEKYGWYPKGGGVLDAEISRINHLSCLDLQDRGELKKLSGTALISNLPMHIADREKGQCLKRLFEYDASLEGKAKIETVEAPSIGQGTEFFLQAEYENTTAGFSSLGEIGKPAERLADEAVQDFVEFHKSGAAVDSRLADQILLYLAFAKGKSTFTTSRISNHLFTNAWLIKQFLPDIGIGITGQKGEKGKVAVDGLGLENIHIGR